MTKILHQKIGVYETEVLKGLFNRFVLSPKETTVSSTGDASRFEFVSLENTAAFEHLKTEIAAICAMVKLSLVANANKSGNIESIMTKSLASVFAGGRFINRLFDAKTADDILRTTADERSAKLDELFSDIPSLLTAPNVAVEFKSFTVDNSKVANSVVEKISSYALSLETSIANAETNDFYKYLTTV